MIVKLPVPAFAPLEIIALEAMPDYFAQVARWHHQECERQGVKSTLALRQQRLVLHVQEASIPKTLIALRDGELVGCVSLVNYTYRSSERMPKVASESPLWLSNLFVLENLRHQGIGNALIEAAKQYARDLGQDELWLSATDYTDYYQKRGWEIVRRTRLAGRQVNVMRVSL
jgi:N-acetylglutamate synthase-like GNAT family acetyltransferase